MATNILENIRKNLGYPPLQKIDPNSQETKKHDAASTQQKLAQAAIPSVLTALYKLTRKESGQTIILSNAGEQGWLNLIYEGKTSEAVDKVAQYAGVSSTEAETHMENIAKVALAEIRHTAGTNATGDKIKAIMNDQRHNILVCLPASMQMGDLLNDEGLDDRTNKMEGPISNLMHSIENSFSGGNDKPKYP
jgi:hypothetical protein